LFINGRGNSNPAVSSNMVGNKQKVNTPQLIKPIEAEESEVGTK
jgi:hypothetical protein